MEHLRNPTNLLIAQGWWYGTEYLKLIENISNIEIWTQTHEGTGNR